MFDIKWIRDNPEEFDRGMERRGLEPQAAGLIALDATRREAQTKAQDIQAERNRLSKEIGAAKAKGEDAQDIMDAVSKTKTAEAEAEVAQIRLVTGAPGRIRTCDRRNRSPLL